MLLRKISNFIKPLAHLVLTLGLVLPISVMAESDSFITENEVFIAIENPNREAETWATCSAALDIFSVIIAKDAPAQAKQLHQLANGSAMAIAMSLIANELEEDVNPKQFPSLFKFAQSQIDSLVDVKSTMLISEFEMMKQNSQQEQFMTKLTKTIEICSSNRESQQMYVDMWRELAKSGILK
jgi:hypothetical protein